MIFILLNVGEFWCCLVNNGLEGFRFGLIRKYFNKYLFYGFVF